VLVSQCPTAAPAHSFHACPGQPHAASNSKLFTQRCVLCDAHCAWQVQ
jgi:hypothetical protein